jgi:hypothetical protein
LRLRAYLLIPNNRSRLSQLEQNLLDCNLLNFEAFNAMKSNTSTMMKSTASLLPSSSASLSSLSGDDMPVEKKFDHVKAITDELQRKINSNEPILYPPKDYDTLHAAHGNIQRAAAWKSTEVKK